MTTANEISIVLSGGSNNSNPANSLGGNPSTAALVSATLNNLFSDVSPEDAVTGITDYRCIYIFNDGSNTVYNIKIWFLSAVADGADLELGVLDLDEVQRITISGATVTGGSLTLSYAGVTFETEYNSVIGDWAASIQGLLNSLVDISGDPLLRQVVVTGQVSTDTIIFDVLFQGQDGSRNHSELVVVDNSLTPAVDVELTVSITGSPINTIPSELDVSTTPPGGVVFSAPTADDPLVLPKLAPGEGFPLWFQRIVASGTQAVNADGATFRITMDSLDPLG